MAKRKPITYEESKGLARRGDAAERKSLAARTDVKPEILYYLADDPEPEVRRQIAVNDAVPRRVDLKLARDADEDVRSGLAGKIARLAPGLTADEQDTIRRMTHEALVILARDEAPRVRRILSEALKDVADAPPEVIGRLARDVELVVAGPVLEFSPVLTDEDLLEIIAGDPVHGSLAAISRRPGVAGPVADAISDTGDAEAIAALLANPSTQIREETLDSIIERAVDVESWHLPLVKRPKLPARAALRLARFVARSLLETLTERKDLDPDTALAVAAEVRKRLDEEHAAEPAADAVAKLEGESPLDAARRLLDEGKLDQAAVAQTLETGDGDFVMAALAVLAGLPLKVIEKTVQTKSVKGLVAVAWKAGLPMRLAERLQGKLAKIPPRNVMLARGGTDYPLSDEELEWQLDFIKDLG
ncbi:MAG: DUF2336 domain-containing protein [Proteobacteria bacterium]|nr:DUF2336 domain-containing protein [Pseudomonadota bacterium]